MTVFDLEEKQGAWFEMDGGGRVCLNNLTGEDWKSIRRKTVKKRVEYKKVDGTPGRFEVEDVNADLENELFWDALIGGWENFFDAKGKEIQCTKENKILLMSRSIKFAKFVNECFRTLVEDEAVKEETLEKN